MASSRDRRWLFTNSKFCTFSKRVRANGFLKLQNFFLPPKPFAKRYLRQTFYRDVMTSSNSVYQKNKIIILKSYVTEKLFYDHDDRTLLFLKLFYESLSLKSLAEHLLRSNHISLILLILIKNYNDFKYSLTNNSFCFIR